MDGGCRASSLGVLINKLSQSCRAPSNNLPLSLSASLSLFLQQKILLPSVLWSLSLSLSLSLYHQLFSPNYVHRLIACSHSEQICAAWIACFPCLRALVRTCVQRTVQTSVRIPLASTSILRELLLCLRLVWWKSFNLLHKCLDFCAFNLCNVLGVSLQQTVQLLPLFSYSSQEFPDRLIHQA